MRAPRRSPEGAPPTATLASVDPDYGTALPGERGRSLLGVPELASGPPIHCGFSNTTVTISATSLPPSCLVVTLTIQPGLTSDNASGCATNPVFPGSVGRVNLTIFDSGLRMMVTSRVLPFAVVWSVSVLPDASIAFTAPEIGPSSATEWPALTTATTMNAPITDIALVTSSSWARHLCRSSRSRLCRLCATRQRQHVVRQVPCLIELERVGVRRHRRAGEPRHECPIHVLWPRAVLEALGPGQIRRGDRQVTIVLERRRGWPVTAAPLTVTGHALGIGVELLAAGQPLRR